MSTKVHVTITISDLETDHASAFVEVNPMIYDADRNPIIGFTLFENTPYLPETLGSLLTEKLNDIKTALA